MGEMKPRILMLLCLTPALLFWMTGCAGTLSVANDHLKKENYSQAIPLYQEHLAADPEDWNARTRLGYACLKTGRLDMAAEELEAVLAKRPGDPLAVLYLGQVYLNRDEHVRALNTWNTPRSRKMQQVEEEIRFQKLQLQIARSHRAAKAALEQEDRLQASRPDPNTVAVCYFSDLTPDGRLKPFQKGLAAMTISYLTKIESLKVVERVQLQALLQEMNLGQTGILDRATAPRVGLLLGAGHLLVGTLAEGIDATASLAETRSSDVTGTARLTVPEQRFYELPMVITREMVTLLNIELTSTEEAAIGVPLTRSYKAVLYYGKGLDAQDAGKWSEAKDYFAAALKEDPDFGLAMDMHDQYIGLGEDEPVMHIAPLMLLPGGMQRGINKPMGAGAF